MTIVTPIQAYDAFAQVIRTATNYFSGHLSHPTEQGGWACLNATLILYHSRESGEILNVVPVWWEAYFEAEDGRRLPLDFDFDELKNNVIQG